MQSFACHLDGGCDVAGHGEDHVEPAAGEDVAGDSLDVGKDDLAPAGFDGAEMRLT